MRYVTRASYAYVGSSRERRYSANATGAYLAGRSAVAQLGMHAIVASGFGSQKKAAEKRSRPERLTTRCAFETYTSLVQRIIASPILHTNDRADADKFLRQFKPTFDVRFDPAGELAASYSVKTMPSSVLIDRHGVTRFTHMGFRPVDSPLYEAQLRELLAEK